MISQVRGEEVVGWVPKKEVEMAMVQPEMLVADWTRIPNSCP